MLAHMRALGYALAFGCFLWDECRCLYWYSPKCRIEKSCRHSGELLGVSRGATHLGLLFCCFPPLLIKASVG